MEIILDNTAGSDVIILLTLRKKSPHSELFWSAFSRIRTEYGEISAVRMRSECRKMWNRINPNTDTFHAV